MVNNIEREIHRTTKKQGTLEQSIKSLQEDLDMYNLVWAISAKIK